MKNKITAISFISILSLTSMSCIISSYSSNNFILASSACDHSGFHYSKKLATSTSTGNKEFYSCCKCHTVFYNSSGLNTANFTDCANTSSATGGLNKNAILYYATFNVNGGSGGTTSVNNLSSNEYISNITVPKRDGYTFNGYYDSTSFTTQYFNNAGKQVKLFDKAKNNFAFVAKWTQLKYTVSIENGSAWFHVSQKNDGTGLSTLTSGTMFTLVSGKTFYLVLADASSSYTYKSYKPNLNATKVVIKPTSKTEEIFSGYYYTSYYATVTEYNSSGTTIKTNKVTLK